MSNTDPPDKPSLGSGKPGSREGAADRLKALGRQTDEAAAAVQMAAERVQTGGRPRHAPVIARPGGGELPGGPMADAGGGLLGHRKAPTTRGDPWLAGRPGETIVASQDYGGMAKALHWLIAVLVAGLVALGLYMKRAALPLPTRFELYQWHKSIGLTVLGLMLVRVLWRLLRRPPAFPASMSRLERQAAQFAHVLLYALLIALPITGWLMVSSSTLPVATRLYGLVPVPHYAPFAEMAVEARRAYEAYFKQVHFVLAMGLLALVAVHVAAALRHHYILKDHIMDRMLPRRWSRRGLLLVVAGLAALVLAGVLPVRAQEAPAWKVDAAKSTLAFEAEGGGQAVPGRFEKFAVDLRFDPDAPERTKITVEIELASVKTGTGDVDQMLADKEWFDSKGQPRARYVADRAEKTADGGYRLLGNLALKGQTRPVAVPFRLAIQAGRGRFTGELVLDRMQFGVGPAAVMGTPIGKDVKLKIAIEAERGG